jgi:hypothetical protein
MKLLKTNDRDNPIKRKLKKYNNQFPINQILKDGIEIIQF